MDSQSSEDKSAVSVRGNSNNIQHKDEELPLPWIYIQTGISTRDWLIRDQNQIHLYRSVSSHPQIHLLLINFCFNYKLSLYN